MKAQRKAESKLAIEQIEEEGAPNFVQNSRSKFGGSELKLIPEEIEQTKVIEALRGKTAHTAKERKEPVAFNTLDLVNFNTKQNQLIKSCNKEAVTEEEKILKSLFAAQDADQALAEFEAEKGAEIE